MSKSDTNIQLIYFYMEGCPYCVQFDPVWKELCKKIDDKIIMTNKFEKDEKDSNNISKKILKEYNKPVEGYPTILIKINDKFYKYTGSRTVNDIINFMMEKLEKTSKMYDYLNKISGKKTEEKRVKLGENGNAELIYFYMNGCHYCDQFNPVWNEFCKNVNQNMIKTLRFGGHEIDNRDTPQRIVTEYGKEIEGFPTVLLKLDDKFYNFDKERTIKSLAKFIMEKLDENDKLYKYLNDKFSELKNNIEKDDKNKDYDQFNCNGKQNGGMKNIDYRNKYKKYKQMYAELAIKYNELKKKK